MGKLTAYFKRILGQRHEPPTREDAEPTNGGVPCGYIKRSQTRVRNSSFPPIWEVDPIARAQGCVESAERPYNSCRSASNSLVHECDQSHGPLVACPWWKHPKSTHRRWPAGTGFGMDLSHHGSCRILQEWTGMQEPY